MALDVPQEYTRPQEDASQLLVEALRRKDPERIREVRELAHRRNDCFGGGAGG